MIGQAGTIEFYLGNYLPTYYWYRSQSGGGGHYIVPDLRSLDRQPPGWAKERWLI